MSTGMALLILAVVVAVCMTIFGLFILMDDTVDNKRKRASKDEIDQYFADIYTELNKDNE